jgi:hypothetical protein
MRTLFLLSGLLLALPSQAARESHGGDAVICPNPGPNCKAVELFDYFEGKETAGLEPSLGAPTLDYKAKAMVVINRIRKIDPTGAAAYEKRLEGFDPSKQVGLVDRFAVEEIDDSEEIIDPANGRFKAQWVAQKHRPAKFEKKYLTDGLFWRNADNDHRAGLALHEIFYGDYLDRELGQYYPPQELKSDGIRYFNAVMSSVAGESITPQRYLNLLKDAGLLKDVNQSTMDWAAEHGNPSWSAIKHTVKVNGETYLAAGLAFNPNGTVRTGTILNPNTVKVRGLELKVRTNPGNLETNLEFHPNGSLAKANLVPGQVIPVQDMGVTLTNWYNQNEPNSDRSTSTEFHSNGSLKSAVISGGPYRFRTEKGKFKTLNCAAPKRWCRVQFDEQEVLIDSREIKK